MQAHIKHMAVTCLEFESRIHRTVLPCDQLRGSIFQPLLASMHQVGMFQPSGASGLAWRRRHVLFQYFPTAWLPDNAATLFLPHAIVAFQLFACLLMLFAALTQARLCPHSQSFQRRPHASRDLSANRHLGKPALTILVLVALAFQTCQTVYGQGAFVGCHVVNTNDACVSCSAVHLLRQQRRQGLLQRQLQ